VRPSLSATVVAPSPTRLLQVSAAVCLLAALSACGKKGDPLAPLRLVPAPATEVSARRTAQEVELRFLLPTANAGAPGPIDLERIEIYAITIAAGAVTPANRDLLTKERVVGTIAVRPPPVDGEEPPAVPGAPPDKRPAPGDRIAFVEALDEAKLKPVAGYDTAAPVADPAKPPADPAAVDTTAKPVADPAKPVAAAPPAVVDPLKPAADPAKPAADPRKPAADPVTPAADPAQTPSAAAAPEKTPVPLHPARIYVLRGISRAGRAGPPSARVSIPLVSPVAAPTAVAARMPTEKAIVVDWTPPVATAGDAPIAFNVHRQGAAGPALNPQPLTDVKFEVAAEYGKEHCFVVRAIQTLQSVTIESEPSAPACLTPTDRFAPAAPRGLRAVAEDGAVNLVWDANGEEDLGGYLVLRAETPGETLQPLTPQPIKDPNYRDATAKPGVRYTYAVVAVDRATPRNASPQSAPESVTAR
jgi:hypothetical protein